LDKGSGVYSRVPHDYTRSRNALVGCLGLTIIAFLVLPLSIRRVARRVDDGKPCMLTTERLKPLVIGDSVRIVMGTQQLADCTSREADGFKWSSSDPAVDVSEEGMVRGRSIGSFTLQAKRRSEALTTDGFVLPHGWRARIEPDSFRIRVGDSLAIRVTALDSAGASIPNVPFSLFAPEFFDPIRTKRPIVNKYSWENVVGPVYVVATDTGSTMLLGRIGFEQVTAKVRILPKR
jgi:hypothetical protein